MRKRGKEGSREEEEGNRRAEWRNRRRGGKQASAPIDVKCRGNLKFQLSKGELTSVLARTEGADVSDPRLNQSDECDPALTQSAD